MGRSYNNVSAVREALDDLLPHMVVQGGAPGADRLAARWARTMGVQLVTFEAMWDALGKAAGPQRNEMMARFGVHMQAEGHQVKVLAFPGTRGTADMIKQSENHGLQVLRITEGGG